MIFYCIVHGKILNLIIMCAAAPPQFPLELGLKKENPSISYIFRPNVLSTQAVILGWWTGHRVGKRYRHRRTKSTEVKVQRGRRDSIWKNSSHGWIRWRSLARNMSPPPSVTAAVYIPCPFNSACSSPFMDLAWLLLKRANPNSWREKKKNRDRKWRLIYFFRMENLLEGIFPNLSFDLLVIIYGHGVSWACKEQSIHEARLSIPSSSEVTLVADTERLMWHKQRP